VSADKDAERRDSITHQIMTAIDAGAVTLPALLNPQWGILAGLSFVLSKSIFERTYGAKNSEKLGDMIDEALRDHRVFEKLDQTINQDEAAGIFIRANDAARKASDEQKLRYIRNVVLNSLTVPLSREPDKERHIKLVEDLTFYELETLVEFCRVGLHGDYQKLEDYVYAKRPSKISAALSTFVYKRLGLPESTSSATANDLTDQLLSTFGQLESAALLSGNDAHHYTSTPFTYRFLRFVLDPEALRK